jgi:L-iditol 2-dehydrogenase
MPERLAFAEKFGADVLINPRNESVVERVKQATDGRGADVVLVAAPMPALVLEALEALRPGGRVMLFAQTSRKDFASLPLASICVDEKSVFGSYSADIDLQDESAALVFGRQLPLAELITHRFPLEGIEDAIALAYHPRPDSLKILVRVQN